MGKLKRSGGLRRRWLMNTVSVISTLGICCVLIITAVFTAYYYNNLESDMRRRAQETTDFFDAYLDRDYNEYYRSCITYTRTFEERNAMELQFIDARGQVVVSSYGQWAGTSPTTSDIAEALESRKIKSFVGSDPDTGEQIIAVSSPMIYSNGQVVGVLRYVTSTRIMDQQILKIGAISLVAFLIIMGAMLLSSSYYIRTILIPVAEITEKAKKIASGSYGAQIKTKYNDEIGDLARTVNEMSVKINENEKLQTEFVSSLSHELRTPLTAINGWSETLLSGDDLDEQTRRGMKIIQSESKRLTEMVVELLDFTRLQDGRFTLNMEQTDLLAVFEDTVYMYGSRLAQDGISIHYLPNDEEIPEISCDPQRMRQVFLNILDNAAKYGGVGKRIDASMTAEEEDVLIRIRDYGPGIAENQLPLVKKKFYKGSSKSRGAGIGLAVCDEIVQLHGGSLDLENAVGGGTLVIVRLPIAQ